MWIENNVLVDDKLKKQLTMEGNERGENAFTAPNCNEGIALPALSALFERVFGHGRNIRRPYRSQLSANVLANLIFCKCNTFKTV
ncbi:zinc finger BED domain-containing protein 4-like [Tachysurus ichikawai]